MKTKILSLGLALATLPAVAASTLTLAWDRSPDTNVNAYTVYAWTNTPDADCVISNAAQAVTVGDVTNATLNFLQPGHYTFAATARVTSTGAESGLSNFAYYQVPQPPTYLITVQTSTNLTAWTNTALFFRLQITPPQP